jgi:hypothetical protein
MKSTNRLYPLYPNPNANPIDSPNPLLIALLIGLCMAFVRAGAHQINPGVYAAMCRDILVCMLPYAVACAVLCAGRHAHCFGCARVCMPVHLLQAHPFFGVACTVLNKHQYLLRFLYICRSARQRAHISVQTDKLSLRHSFWNRGWLGVLMMLTHAW